MAPEIVRDAIVDLSKGSTILDPLSGSGTVLRWAIEFGHRAHGRDLDPLAVTIARAWTARADLEKLTQHAKSLIDRAFSRRCGRLPWLTDDVETNDFIDFWFAEPQKTDLSRLAYQLYVLERDRPPTVSNPAIQLLKTAFSRMIITKENGASLARDVSHSRPHRVKQTTSYDVRSKFLKIVTDIRGKLESAPPPGGATVRLGDARQLKGISRRSVDAIITSPPYLNAIDYMRGHRLSLVWLGYRLADLRAIRSSSVGAERKPDVESTNDEFSAIEKAMLQGKVFGNRRDGMIRRYAEDLYLIASEISRVIKRKGKAILVVGNSTVSGNFVRNSHGMIQAAELVGLEVTSLSERELPLSKRYLPIGASDGALAKRMRTESVIEFQLAAG